MTKEKYTPLPPEPDPNLQSNPHYWLYKVTREALDNKDHPLHDMGHIWNRWAYEGLSEEEREEIRIGSKYPSLHGSSKSNNHGIIIDYIRNIEGFKDWEFPDANKIIDFTHTVWGKDVDFSEFTFIQRANFYSAKFTQDVSFFKAEFTQYADFMETTFIKDTNFIMVKFIQYADFFNTIFTQYVDFQQTIFEQTANFSSVTFKKEIDFSITLFKQNVTFWKAKFYQTVDFSNTAFFGDIVIFCKSTFFKPTNQNAEFSFKNTIFNSKVNFSESEFHHLPNLTGTDFRAGINLDKVKFLLNDADENCHCEEARRADVAISFKPRKRLFSIDFLRDCHTSLRSFAMTVTSVFTGLLRPVNRTRNDETILGGLSPKDAAVTWHALSTEMEKAGYHDQALEYFGYELDAKRLNTKDNDRIFRGVLWLYKIFSNYGKSIKRPFIAWGALAFIWFFVYYCLISQNLFAFYWNDIIYSLKFSFKGLFPFVSDQTTFFDRMFVNGKNAETVMQSLINPHEPIGFNNNFELLAFPFLYGFHSLCSLILIFLFGLGVRNRLRLR